MRRMRQKGKGSWPATAATSFAPTCKKSVSDRELAISCLLSWKSSWSRLPVLVPRTAWAGALRDMSTTRRHFVRTASSLQSTQTLSRSTNKGTRDTGTGYADYEAIIAKCLRREGRTTADWRAGRPVRGRVGARLRAACLCLSCMLKCTRLASANCGDPTGESPTADIASTPIETTNDAMRASAGCTILVLLHL